LNRPPGADQSAHWNGDDAQRAALGAQDDLRGVAPIAVRQTLTAALAIDDGRRRHDMYTFIVVAG
jgi:hypothetical protein